MDKRVLLGITAAVTLVLPVAAFAQAAAESALTNSLSSSTTIKLGSTLNHALNQSGAQLGAHIQDLTSGSVQQKTRPIAPEPGLKSVSPLGRSADNLRGGSGQAVKAVSVQGGETACQATAQSQGLPASATPARVASGTESNGCPVNKSSSASEKEKYKPYVTLSFPE